MLQLEFDRENDRLLRAEEKQYNRESKGELPTIPVAVCPLLQLLPPFSVRVSLERYRSLPASYLEDDDEDQLGEEEEEAEGGERVEPTPSVSRGRRRSKGVPVGMATKHDPVVCGRRNARNVEKVGPASKQVALDITLFNAPNLFRSFQLTSLAATWEMRQKISDCPTVSTTPSGNTRTGRSVTPRGYTRRRSTRHTSMCSIPRRVS